MSRKKVKVDLTEKKIFFEFFMLRRLESVFKDERKKIFLEFFFKLVFRFLRLTDQHFILHFWDLLNCIEKLMAVILIVSSKKLAQRNTFIFKEKGWKRPSLNAPAPRGFNLCRHQWVNSIKPKRRNLNFKLNVWKSETCLQPMTVM